MSANGKEKGGFLRIVISVGAIVAILLRIMFPALFERIDAVSVALIVVALIPWLSPIISKIAIPGVIEAELRELKQELQEAKEGVATAANINFRNENAALLSRETVTINQNKTEASKQLMRLGAEYAKVRGSMAAGPTRTAAMDKLFGEMLKEAGRLGENWPELADAMRSADAGTQLSAIAYSFAFPGTADVTALVGIVERAKHPFVQYWGLRAIQRAIDAGCDHSIQDLERLEYLAAALGRGTDRYLIAVSIVRSLKKNRA